MNAWWCKRHDNSKFNYKWHFESIDHGFSMKCTLNQQFCSMCEIISVFWWKIFFLNHSTAVALLVASPSTIAKLCYTGWLNFNYPYNKEFWLSLGKTNNNNIPQIIMKFYFLHYYLSWKEHAVILLSNTNNKHKTNFELPINFEIKKIFYPSENFSFEQFEQMFSGIVWNFRIILEWLKKSVFEWSVYSRIVSIKAHSPFWDM